jgi:L-galactono-1,4-lactone dehydrogenase
MWIPYTDAVVVVSSKRTDRTEAIGPGFLMSQYDEQERAAPLRSLLHAAVPQRAEAELAGLSAMQLRDALIAQQPLSQAWIAKVNAAEAEFWRRSVGYRTGWSDEILGFDCGGQQWVLEVAFPTGGTAKEPAHKARPTVPTACCIAHKTHWQ